VKTRPASATSFTIAISGQLQIKDPQGFFFMQS
jgi:hypothetical protein